VTISKPFKIGVVVVLAAAAGFLIFSHIYRVDMRALEGFVASCGRFDEVMPAEPGRNRPGGLDAEREALADVQARASLRLSSLIRNDNELMAQAREVADLAQREFESLRAYDAGLAAQTGGRVVEVQAEKLDREYVVLQVKRKAAFARFMELGGTAGRYGQRGKGGNPHGS
jgi:hypothetical protein